MPHRQDFSMQKHAPSSRFFLQTNFIQENAPQAGFFLLNTDGYSVLLMQYVNHCLQTTGQNLLSLMN